MVLGIVLNIQFLKFWETVTPLISAYWSLKQSIELGNCYEGKEILQ